MSSSLFPFEKGKWIKLSQLFIIVLLIITNGDLMEHVITNSLSFHRDVDLESGPARTASLAYEPPLLPTDESLDAFLALEHPISDFCIAKKQIITLDFEFLFDAYLKFLSERSSWKPPHLQSSSVQKIYFSSRTDSFKKFEEEVFENAGRFASFIPHIHQLILDFSIHLSRTETAEMYTETSNRNESLLFFCFTPLLLFYPMEPIIAETILNLFGGKGFFSTCINDPLLKKCLEICPAHPLKATALFENLDHNFVTFKGNPYDHLPKILNEEFFMIFLNSSPSFSQLSKLFFKLLTHSLLTSESSEKAKCHVLISSFIEKYPKLLNSYRPKTSSKVQEQSVKKLCFSVLISHGHGHDLRSQLYGLEWYGYSSTLFFWEVDKVFFQNLLIEIDQTIHPRYSNAEKIELERLFPKDSPEWAYFNSTGIFNRFSAPISDFSTVSAEEIQSLLRLKTSELDYNRQKGNLSAQRIDMSLVLECHTIKKSLKGMDKSPFLREYSAFVSSYNKIVDHIPLLSFIRSMSREIRSLIIKKSASPSSALRKFIYLWNDASREEESYEHLGASIMTAPELFKSILIRGRNKIIPLAKKYFESDFWNTHDSSQLHIHGTKIGALHLIKKLPPHERALRATGDLLKRGIAPLTGELCGSHTLWNASKLSFSSSSFQWDDVLWREKKPHSLIFSAPSSFSQSLLYATKNLNPYGSSSSYQFNLEAVWEEISVGKLKPLLAFYQQELASPFILKILQVRITDPRADEKLLPLKELIEEFRRERGAPLLGHNFYEALTKELAFTLSPDEVRLTEDPTPLIFGVTSHFPNPKGDVSSSEVRLTTGLKLGRSHDTSIAFTTEENVARLEELSRDSDLEICSIEELILIESLHMTEGSRIQELHIESICDTNLQATIAKAVQQFAAPHYAKPLPRKPIAPIEPSSPLKIGAQRELIDPFFGHLGGSSYDEYARALEENPKLPARNFHGTMHMLRATLFSQIFYKVFKKSASAKELYLVAMSAAYHDSARQDEGVDRWDELSAWKLRRFLMNHNSSGREDSEADSSIISEEEIAECYLALASKDPRDGIFTSDIQKAVHDADCLEIIRCLHTPSEFLTSRLEAKSLIDPSDFDQLILESKRFIEETETLESKSFYEYESENPYEDLLSYLHDPKNGYPILLRYFTIGSDGGGCGAGAGSS